MKNFYIKKVYYVLIFAFLLISFETFSQTIDAGTYTIGATGDYATINAAITSVPNRTDGDKLNRSSKKFTRKISVPPNKKPKRYLSQGRNKRVRRVKMRNITIPPPRGVGMRWVE